MGLTTKRLVTMSGELSQSSFYGVSKVIDTATHVWGNGCAEFPFATDPPPELKDNSGVGDLKALMDTSGVATTLITQPINYKFDHSYLDSILDSTIYIYIYIIIY